MIYPNSKSNQRGFTIVELLIVIVVISILTAITVVAYNGVQNRARTVAAQSAANNVQKKAEAYNAEEGSYPLTSTALTGADSSESYSLTGVTFTLGESAPDSPSDVKFIKCGSGSPASQAAITASNITGVRIYYWDYVNGNASSYNRAGIDSGGTVACPAS